MYTYIIHNLLIDTLILQTWTSLKSNVKAKASKIAVHAKGTGGGSPLKPLSEFEERVLAVSGLESVTGDESLQEAGCSKKTQPQTSSCRKKKEVPPVSSCSKQPDDTHVSSCSKQPAVNQASIFSEQVEALEDEQPDEEQAAADVLIPPVQQIFSCTEANATVSRVLLLITVLMT